MPMDNIDEVRPDGDALIDAVPRNGVDHLAVRRAHMRTITMARQAAERRSTPPMARAGHDRATQVEAAQERATALRTELAGINAEYRIWLHDQGGDVPGDRA